MRAGRVLETCLYADDLAAGEQFYSNVLGLEVYSRIAGRHVFFRCGDAMFLLFNPAATEQEGGPVPSHGAYGKGHVAFAMHQEEILGWREHLEQSGIGIEADVVWPSGGKSLYIRDPAGNSVELTSPSIWKLADPTDMVSRS
jgi:catechol 2,3-dioxygenase-like lactoylglutathione lyase family enzyme